MDPQYRELLSVANGWEDFNLGLSLLGTEDTGVGARWEDGLMQSRVWFEDACWGDRIGAPNDASVYQLVVANENDFSGTVFVFVGESNTLPTGAAVPLEPEQTYPDLYSYFVEELDVITDWEG